MSLKRSFAPVVDDRTRLLILGSLPGEASLARGQYYAHPRNGFWPLVGGVIGRDLASLPYDERLAALLTHRVGLWDVIAEAERHGSLDGAIRLSRDNDLVTLVNSLPNLRAVAFNGGKAGKSGMKLLAGHADRLKLVTLPSSSPALARPLAAKREVWNCLADWVEKPARQGDAGL